MPRIAVLDLGTNTFHLLVVEAGGSTIQALIHRERIFVKLASGGIDKLADDAMQRGIEALIHFQHTLSDLAVDMTHAVGTAALRTAENGPAYLQRIMDTTGLKVELIDGDREALLIYAGVKQIWKPSQYPALIMDIGGGSVEFILASAVEVLWAQSFPVGVSVLYQKYHQLDPISTGETKALRQFLADELPPLMEIIATYQPKLLVGASGTFDVIADFCGLPIGTNYGEISISKLHDIIDRIAAMTIEERRTHPLIPDTRIDMIVVAVLLIQHILDSGSFNQLGISNYALKEGLIANILDLSK
jgi:exopolyphosphatase/guanosine-5'-triphosphate,3'-diphosphate pyrophosphatase